MTALGAYSIADGCRGTNWMQETGGENGYRNHGGTLLSPHGLLSLLSYIAREYLPAHEVVLTTVSEAFPHKYLIKKMSHRLAYRPVGLVLFSQSKLLLLSMCQVEKVKRRRRRKKVTKTCVYPCSAPLYV